MNRMTNFEAITINQNESIAKAKLYLKQATKVGARTTSRRARFDQSMLLSIIPWELNVKQEIKYTILAAESFKISGEHYWYDSAETYEHAGALFADVLHDPKSAAEYYEEAGKVIEKVDTDFATKYYRQAITRHCDASQYENGAVIQDRIANNLDKKKDFAAAIQEYHRAAKLYYAANIKHRAIQALGRAAYLLAAVGKFRESADAYETIARRQAEHSMVTSVKSGKAGSILRSGILLICDSLEKSENLGWRELKKFMQRIDSVHSEFNGSLEQQKMLDIFQSISDGDINKFVDSVYSLDDALCGFDDIVIDALDKIENIIIKRQKNSVTHKEHESNK